MNTRRCACVLVLALAILHTVQGARIMKMREQMTTEEDSPTLDEQGEEFHGKENGWSDALELRMRCAEVRREHAEECKERFEKLTEDLKAGSLRVQQFREDLAKVKEECKVRLEELIDECTKETEMVEDDQVEQTSSDDDAEECDEIFKACKEKMEKYHCPPPHDREHEPESHHEVHWEKYVEQVKNLVFPRDSGDAKPSPECHEIFEGCKEAAEKAGCKQPHPKDHGKCEMKAMDLRAGCKKKMVALKKKLDNGKISKKEFARFSKEIRSGCEAAAKKLERWCRDKPHEKRVAENVELLAKVENESKYDDEADIPVDVDPEQLEEDIDLADVVEEAEEEADEAIHDDDEDEEESASEDEEEDMEDEKSASEDEEDDHEEEESAAEGDEEESAPEDDEEESAPEDDEEESAPEDDEEEEDEESAPEEDEEDDHEDEESTAHDDEEEPAAEDEDEDEDEDDDKELAGEEDVTDEDNEREESDDSESEEAAEEETEAEEAEAEAEEAEAEAEEAEAESEAEEAEAENEAEEAEAESETEEASAETEEKVA